MNNEIVNENKGVRNNNGVIIVDIIECKIWEVVRYRVKC